ncbi:MAG: class I SAM-dependent methyltransferase [Nakamurella sp.]
MTTSSGLRAPRPVTPSTILADRLHQLVQRCAAADSVDDSLVAGLRDAYELASGLDPYLSRCTTPESAALGLLAARTGAYDWELRSTTAVHLEQEMLSGHVEGQVLQMLVHASRARRVLEIGMFTGYSALAMAEMLPADGTVVACEIDTEVAAFAQQSFDDAADGHKITIKVGPALATLDELAAAGAVFDLIFLDADKAGYLDYLHTVLDGGLLAPHGLLCVDNTLMQGQPWGAGQSTANGVAISDFNDSVAADPRIAQVIIPLRDGLTLIRQVGQETS